MSDTSTTPNLDYSNLQSVVKPYDDGPPYHEFLDPTYIAIMRSIVIEKMHVVRPEEQYNLQLISFNMYGTTDLWWVIGMVNAIVNPLLQLVSGMEIDIPSLTSIQDYFNSIRTRQTSGVINLP